MEYSFKLLPTAWSTPIVPHAFPMVCRVYHTCWISQKKHDVSRQSNCPCGNIIKRNSLTFSETSWPVA